MTTLFWVSASLVLYVYFVYPGSLWAWTKLAKSRHEHCQPDGKSPGISVIVAARNEADNIEQRILNFLKQSYPVDRMEIIVVSDGSTDATASIVRSIAAKNEIGGAQRIVAIELAENKGKPHALNIAIKEARNDILIMADARQTFHVDAIRHLVSTLSDPSIGCVSGELRLQASTSGKTHGVEMGIYWRYERFIRRLEAELSSVVGMTGAIYAIRRNLYDEIPENILIDDVLIPMNVVRKGYRASYNSSAIASDTLSITPSQEWKRKVRTMAGNWQLLRIFPWLLSPVHNPIFLQFFSHKVGRLLVPFALVATLICSYAISTPFYSLLAAIQTSGILLGLSGIVVPNTRKLRPISLAYFFLLLNASVIVGMIHGLRPEARILWSDAHKDH